jgi:ATP-dependent Clp protease adapter protein ClpS
MSGKRSSFGQVERFPYIIEPWNVVLINDDWHSLDDVIMQLIKATGCSVKEATDLVWEAEQRGEAVCFAGEKKRCEFVGHVLDEIELRFRLERMT